MQRETSNLIQEECAQALRQRFATARLLQNQVEQTHGVQISTQTIKNRLREYDLRPRDAARGPALTPAHRRALLDFAKEHIHWEEADWERILFTDESRFCLYHLAFSETYSITNPGYKLTAIELFIRQFVTRVSDRVSFRKRQL